MRPSRLVAIASAAALAFVAFLGLGGHPAAPARANSRLSAVAGGRPQIRLRVFRFVDRSRVAVFRNGASAPRKLVTYLRYPSEGRAPFPLVVFCHGFALLPSTYARLLDAWTRAGYAVAAPVFPVENADAPGGPDEADLVNQPADVRFVISQLLRATRNKKSRIYGLIDPTRIAVAGHSDGGDTAFAVAYERAYLDWRVRAAVILSGAVLPPEQAVVRRSRPSLLAVQGTADQINLPSATRELFRDATRPKYLLTLFHAGHLGPYTHDRIQRGLVERVTIAFLNHDFKKAPLRQLVTAGNDPRVSHLRSLP